MHLEKYYDCKETDLYQLFSKDGLNQLDWRALSIDGRKGVDIVNLYDARVDGVGSCAALVKYGPGAIVPPHLHVGFELIFVLEGELINDSGSHGPGTLEICPPGSKHGLASKNGCMMIVVWEKPVLKISSNAPA